MCVISFVSIFGLKEYARKEAAQDVDAELAVVAGD
jgi:hypothetical protein